MLFRKMRLDIFVGRQLCLQNVKRKKGFIVKTWKFSVSWNKDEIYSKAEIAKWKDPWILPQTRASFQRQAFLNRVHLEEHCAFFCLPLARRPTEIYISNDGHLSSANIVHSATQPWKDNPMGALEPGHSCMLQYGKQDLRERYWACLLRR